ncbi:hypothetical protein AB0M00_43670 [Streptomyces chartreusis]|uniref:hypothetical protein n=1 Tax=Streptomyces chartreusis TaxID=1969 RepID=UPI00342621B9
MLTTTLIITYGSLIALVNVLFLAGRISHRTACGWMAVLCAGGGVGSAIAGWTSNVYLHAALGAWSAWNWWHSGGGDDTKRRLKSWAGRFHGVRRTAPQGT